MARTRRPQFHPALALLLMAVALMSVANAGRADAAPGGGRGSQAPGRPAVVPGSIVVQLEQGASQGDLRSTLARNGARVDRSLGHGRTLRVKLPDGADGAAVLADLRADSAVSEANFDLVAHAFDLPNDPGYSRQWDMHAGIGGINAPGAWDLSPARGAGVVVAVIDTGLAYEDFAGGQAVWGQKLYKRAPDLAGVPIVAPWDWIGGDAHPNDENGHGTHVSGTIAETANNGIAEAGLSAASIMPLRILDYAGNGVGSDLIDAIYYAADHGAKVINLSLGFSGTGTPAPNGDVCTEIVGLADALDYADAMGVTVVAASGNDGATTVACPAAYPSVIAVGATRYDGTVTFYSNRGSALDVTAPGGDPNIDQNGDGASDQVTQQSYCLDVVTMFLTGDYGQFCDVSESGTSMASPHVAGTAALLIGQLATLSPAQVRAVLQATARDMGAPGPDDKYGYGVIDAAAAMLSVVTNPPPPPPPGPPPKPRPVRQPGATNVAATTLSATSIKVTWTDNASGETGFNVDRSMDGGATWTRAGNSGADKTSYTSYSLLPGTTYTYRVRSYDSMGNSPWSATASATTDPAPSAPEQLTVTSVGAGTVKLAWVDTSSTESGFKVERSTDGITFPTTSYASANATSASVGSLAPSTTYWFRVRAYDGSVNGEASNVVTATTLAPPAAPTGLTATAKTASSIRLDWTDTTTTEGGFKVERSLDEGATWSAAATLTANTVTWTNGNLTPATTYWFRVRAYDGAVNGEASNIASATTLPAPSPPANVTATPVGTTAIQLSWTDTSTTEQGFKVERSLDGGATWSGTNYVAANATGYKVSGLVASTAYSFRVRAYEGSTNGDYSNVAVAATFDPPTPPTGVTAVATGATAVKVSWTNTSSYQAGVRIERSPDGVTWSQVAQVSATTTSWTNTSLAAETGYVFRVRAYESTTNGTYSEAVSVTTLPPPSAPMSLSAIALSATSVKLTWVDTCAYESGFRVERSTDGVTWTQVSSPGANASSSTNTGLTTKTTYYYRVRAYESTVNGPYSAVVTVTTP